MSIFYNLKKAAGVVATDAVKAAIGGGADKEETQTFSFAALPENLEELKALPEAALTSPFQAAALTVCALCAYAASPEMGIQMLNYLKGPQPLSNHEKQLLKNRFASGKHIPFSYFKGAAAENDYTPSRPFTVAVSKNPYTYEEEGYAKLFIPSGGADWPRPLILRRKGEQWFLWEQTLMTGIRMPKSRNPWV